MPSLKQELISRISADPGQMISFRDFMDLCLYHPKDGYYMQSRDKIGKQGDYYTSSSVHPVFAETIAHFVRKICVAWEKRITFCEMGAGTGRFARQFLDALHEIDSEAYHQTRYLIIEKSPYHLRQQQHLLAKHISQVTWAGQPGEKAAGDNMAVKNRVENSLSSFEGILFSNELVDAFPVYVVEKRKGVLYEIGVGYDDRHDRFVEKCRPLANEHILTYLEEFGLQLLEGQRLEVHLDALEWVRKVSAWFKAGLWFTVDYGFCTKELESPVYKRGTLRCFYQHQVDSDPYEQPGQKDITAHVPFDVLSQTAEKMGWGQVGLYPQTEFLLMAGIMDRLEEHRETDPFHPVAKKNRAIHHLISPQGISGALQVLTLAKEVPDKVLNLFQPFSFAKYLKKGY
ncbi:SAM-dependent methyltransferase [Caldalkalibacillus thermarum]|uniref:class I SAM-dependent methyltransferase n=1 Tax=Caldalkalibacillus thermarum TaxID=296745 RepID=UPI001664A0C0|nr:SAM-dependent methyltransferase [Caldalkalibacillus thermarum]GGK15129.1 SAM-dependent methyltransferase [Caldalkalibacillus thermarum]